jgi:hypothetical protein
MRRLGWLLPVDGHVREVVVFIRIIAMPPGEAPEEVRRAWIGLDLPLAAGETGPRVIANQGVLSGARTFLAILRARLAGRTRLEYGYVIDGQQALVLLAEKAPWAAQWWRECAPHTWNPGYKFVFSAEICAEIADDQVGPPPDPAEPEARSEGFFPAGAVEVTRNPAPPSSAERIVKQPLMKCLASGGGGVRITESMEPGQLRFAVLGCLGWLACGSSLLFVLADVGTGFFGLIGLRLVVLAVGLGLVWWSRKAQLHFDQQMIELRRKWETSPARTVPASGKPSRPATQEVEPRPAEPPPQSAAPVPGSRRRPGVFKAFWKALVKAFEPGPPPPTLTFESRGQKCRVEPSVLEPQSLWGSLKWVQHSQDCMQIVPGPGNSASGVLVGVFFPVGLWLVTWITLINADPLPHPRTVGLYIILIPLMQVGAIAAAALGLALTTRRTWIHRGRGEVRRSWFFREQVLCRIADVLAVQVVRQAPRKGGCSQVNLVLGPPSRSRVNLHCQAQRDDYNQETLWFARRLSVFLDVPLVDQVDAMAVRTPTELASLFVPDWVAGPDNVKLIEVGAGILELQHTPQPSASLAGEQKGWQFHSPCAIVRFDRNKGHRPRLFVQMLPGSGHLPEALRKPRSLLDVTAVELAPDPGPALDAGLGPMCSLRLRLNDADHPILELAPRAQQAWARDMGGRLAGFLGVPLEDRLGPEPS